MIPVKTCRKPVKWLLDHVSDRPMVLLICLVVGIERFSEIDLETMRRLLHCHITRSKDQATVWSIKGSDKG